MNKWTTRVEILDIGLNLYDRIYKYRPGAEYLPPAITKQKQLITNTDPF